MSRTKSICSLIAVVALAASAQQATENPPAATMKVEANTVVVDVLVTDKKGHTVPGLTANDFTISEDNVPQKITAFSAPDVIEGAPGTPAPDTRPSVGAGTPAAETPHLITVVLDLSDNTQDAIKRSSDGIIQYLDKKLSPNDFVSIYSFSGRGLRLALPFTNDMAHAKDVVAKMQETINGSALSLSERDSLERTIDDLYQLAHPAASYGATGGSGNGGQTTNGPGATSGPGNANLAALERQIDTLREYLTIQNMYQGRAVFAALRAICLAYRDLPGRKNVVFFSQGFYANSQLRPDMESVADAAARANVAFYVIDSSGLNFGHSDMLAHGPDTRAQQLEQLALERPGGPGSKAGKDKFDRFNTLAEGSQNSQLEYLADTTGGLMMRNTNNLGPAFEKVVTEAREFYTLVYQPTNKDFDAKFRRLKVSLNEGGNQLRYRQGYWAIPRAEAAAMTPAAAVLLTNLRSGVIKPKLNAAVNADLLLAPSGHYSVPVSVSFPGKDVPVQKDGEFYTGNVTMLLTLRDAQGKVVGFRQRDWPVKFAAKDKDDFTKRTLTLQSQVSLPEIQPVTVESVVQVSPDTVAVGTAKVAVPASSGGFNVTSMLLSDHFEQEPCTDKDDPLCFDNVRLFQPTESKFPSATQLVVYYAASNLSLDPQQKKPRVGVAFALKADGHVVPGTNPVKVQAMPGPTPDSVRVLAQYDLKSLSAGKYTLEAITKDMVQQKSQAQQSDFVVQ
jgi:VWFA-related protein